MTLLIYLRCRDGCILVSDRQASAVSGHSREKSKTFLSRRRDFVLAGAGNGIAVDFIFGRLIYDNSVNGENVREKLDELLSEYFSPYGGTTADVFGILVAWENDSATPYEIKIRGAHPSIVPIGTEHLCVGIDAACAIADYLMKKVNYSELPWEAAIQYVVAVMKEVSKEIDGVGRLEEFGFDITAFLDNGYVCRKFNYRRDSATLTVKFDTSEIDVLSEFNLQQIGDESGGI